MLQIFRTYLFLCLFQGSTAQADDRRSTFVLGIVLLALLVIVRLNLLEGQFSPYLLGMIVSTFVLVVIFIYLSLHITKKLARFGKTFSALLGTKLIFEIVACALILVRQQPAFEQETLIVHLMQLGVFFWRIGVIGLILRQAMEISLPMGIGLAALFVFIANVISAVAFLDPSSFTTDM
ncbi:MAG: hypothetical protein OXO49_01535 [Gammaproteobacteria bacterium]|nr:hypothetical protein [Gammaproteobacteria bacterium]MDE0252503.1 hypothetical protein [Gammaproteobacteria bacterium]MDE0403013.1 hypothetical protein [Gammaproteobacteria bacterium]